MTTSQSREDLFLADPSVIQLALVNVSGTRNFREMMV